MTKTTLEYDREKQELISHAAKLAFPIRDGIPNSPGGRSAEDRGVEQMLNSPTRSKRSWPSQRRKLRGNRSALQSSGRCRRVSRRERLTGMRRAFRAYRLNFPKKSMHAR